MCMRDCFLCCRKDGQLYSRHGMILLSMFVPAEDQGMGTPRKCTGFRQGISTIPYNVAGSTSTSEALYGSKNIM